MRERLLGALAAGEGAFVEVRVTRLWTATVAFRGRRLDTAVRGEDAAGVVRCLVPGYGWGVTSFDDPARVEQAVRHARELSLAARRRTPILLATVPVRDEDLAASLPADPRAVSLAEQRALLEHLSAELHAADRRIVDSRIALNSDVRETWLVTSEGASIHDLRADLSLAALAVAEENGTVERAAESLGGRTGWELVRDREAFVRDVATRAVDLLHAPPVRAGRYPVVLDPRSAGALAHRVVGHLTGGDPAADGPQLRPGTRLGPEVLTIGDDGSADGLRATMAYDDEGTPTRNTTLVQNGVVVAALHSRESAARATVAPTGNVRGTDPRSPAAVRLTNTYVARGQGTLDDLLGDIATGVYCRDVVACAEAGGITRFRAASGMMIRQGRLAEPVKDVAFAAETLTLLGRVEGIAGDFAWDGSAATCDGGRWGSVPVTTGAPHLRILDVALGQEPERVSA